MLSTSEIGSRSNVEHIVKEKNMLSMSMLLFLMKYHLTSFALIISDMNDVDYRYYFHYCIPTIHTSRVFINYSYILPTIFIYKYKYVKYQ